MHFFFRKSLIAPHFSTKSKKFLARMQTNVNLDVILTRTIYANTRIELSPKAFKLMGMQFHWISEKTPFLGLYVTASNKSGIDIWSALLKRLDFDINIFYGVLYIFFKLIQFSGHFNNNYYMDPLWCCLIDLHIVFISLFLWFWPR